MTKKAANKIIAGLQEAVVVAPYLAEIERLKNEIEELKGWVIPFLAIYADSYAKDRGWDGLHHEHYDMLKKCDARMDDFKRAEIAEGRDEG